MKNATELFNNIEGDNLHRLTQIDKSLSMYRAISKKIF